MKKYSILTILLLGISNVCFAVSPGPLTAERTHSVGNFYLTITNWGAFGSKRTGDDPEYCILFDDTTENIPDCYSYGDCRPSAEYPACSGIEYLFSGAFWIGGVVAGDTLVSVGEDGWFLGINELLPGIDTTYALDSIREFSIDSLDTEALGNQTFIAGYSDTCTDTAYIPSEHTPLGIQITQKSHQWSDSTNNNFVIFQMTIKNISTHTINDAYFGIFIDTNTGDITYPFTVNDITGFISTYVDSSVSPPETVDVRSVWVADNDGDPTSGHFDEHSCPAALTIIPLSNYDYSYNWWISNTYETYDWGPMRVDNNLGFDGTPVGDVMKYKLMSNGEIDYDQCEIMDYMDDPLWISPPSTLYADFVANGHNPRVLFSFRMGDLLPDSSKKIDFAMAMVDSFHSIDETLCDFNYDAVVDRAREIRNFYDTIVSGIDEEKNLIPNDISICISPNPFNSSCIITAPKNSKIAIYDIRGNLICRRGLPTSNTSNTSIDNSSGNRHQEMSPTEYRFIWTPDKSVPSGIYFIKAITPDRLSIIERIVYIR